MQALANDEMEPVRD
jgi:hypothetical protein